MWFMSMTEEVKQKMWENYGKLPLSFIPNVGQIHEDVQYYIQEAGGRSIL
jgi:hypothetical protein